MIIYIDTDNKCHIINDGVMKEFNVPFFDDKCVAFIEGYRYVPEGETWTRDDGEIFTGEMIAPAVDSRVLEAYQSQYEADAAEREALEILIGTGGVNNSINNSDTNEEEAI